MRALILMLALAACTAEPVKQDPPAETPVTAEVNDVQAALAQMPAWDGARAAGVDFRAVGQEPGWIADIYTRNRIVLLLDYGETLIELPRTEPTSPAEGATRYETQGGGHRASITIRRAPCEDAMSGEAYPSTVELVIDGRALEGCGRTV